MDINHIIHIPTVRGTRMCIRKEDATVTNRKVSVRIFSFIYIVLSVTTDDLGIDYHGYSCLRHWDKLTGRA